MLFAPIELFDCLSFVLQMSSLLFVSLFFHFGSEISTSSAVESSVLESDLTIKLPSVQGNIGLLTSSVSTVLFDSLRLFFFLGVDFLGSPFWLEWVPCLFMALLMASKVKSALLSSVSGS